MTSPTLEAISSGTRYRVTRTDGHLPESAADFVGDTAFLIHQADQNLHIDGVGQLDPCGTGVHFFQKDPAHEGRDVRIWHIRPLPDNQVIAKHIAAI
jgi:hypothetical protein